MMTTSCAFEAMSKRRKGFPSETNVKRGDRIVHGGKDLSEKLGRNDQCPCGSGKSFQALLPAQRLLLTEQTAATTSGDSKSSGITRRSREASDSRL
jgi:SEC-C motif